MRKFILIWAIIVALVGCVRAQVKPKVKYDKDNKCPVAVIKITEK